MPILLLSVVLILPMTIVAGCDSSPAWHASRLRAGHLELRGLRCIKDGEPYHLCRLVDMGSKSAPVLIEMLHDETPLEITYYEMLEFSFIHNYGTTDITVKERVATIGDLADYALRVIFEEHDVGYRSYHRPDKRKEAISKWKKIVRERGFIPPKKMPKWMYDENWIKAAENLERIEIIDRK